MDSTTTRSRPAPPARSETVLTLGVGPNSCLAKADHVPLTFHQYTRSRPTRPSVFVQWSLAASNSVVYYTKSHVIQAQDEGDIHSRRSLHHHIFNHTFVPSISHSPCLGGILLNRPVEKLTWRVRTDVTTGPCAHLVPCLHSL